MRSLILPLAAAAFLAVASSSVASALVPPSSSARSPAAGKTAVGPFGPPRIGDGGAPPLLSPAVAPGRFSAAFGILTVPAQFFERTATTRIYMGWGPDPIWSDAVVTSNVDACPSGSCVSLAVQVSGETADGFTTAGQYVQVRPGGSDENAKPIFLAIASPPTAGEGGMDEADAAAGGEPAATFEFLIKKTDNNDWITSASSGTKLDVSQVLGGGFSTKENMEGFKYDFPTQNVLLFATGSGIAPIRSAIESGDLGIAPSGKGGRTARLYYGVRTPDDMPYADRFGMWEMNGVEVVPVVSQPESSGGEKEWDGRTGYVQNALEEDGVPIPRNSGALMCGVKGMTEAVRDILTKAGVFEGRVMTNF